MFRYQAFALFNIYQLIKHHFFVVKQNTYLVYRLLVVSFEFFNTYIYRLLPRHPIGGRIKLSISTLVAKLFECLKIYQ